MPCSYHLIHQSMQCSLHKSICHRDPSPPKSIPIFDLTFQSHYMSKPAIFAVPLWALTLLQHPQCGCFPLRSHLIVRIFLPSNFKTDFFDRCKFPNSFVIFSTLINSDTSSQRFSASIMACAKLNPLVVILILL